MKSIYRALWTILLVAGEAWATPEAAATLKRDLAALRAAVTDLAATFPDRYSQGDRFIAEMDRLEKELSLTQGVPSEETLLSFRKFRRRALVANPLVSGQPILFVERRQYPPDHHNTGNIFQTNEINTKSFRKVVGGALKTIDFATGEVETLLECPDGTPRDPEIRFDGKRILFSMRKTIDDDYHLYEMDIDGGNLKQLTSAAGISDLDPFYLACGDIAFSSTREPKYCPCNRHIMANLFRMEPDGANILQIGMSTEFEGHGIQLPDGRLLYFRWEYTDRNFGGGQGLWVAQPDGTNHAIYYGQSTPHAMLNPRPIPGSDRIICIISSCHDRPWGALALLDRKLGVEGSRPIVRIWPKEARRLIADARQGYAGSRGFDNFQSVPLKYEDPFALSDKYFLVSRVIERGSEVVGLFLVDTFGNEVLLHRAGAGDRGCFDPMPLRARPRPRILPSRRDESRTEGTFYVADVYEGTHMRGVRRGSIKHLRVVENPAKLYWTDGSWGGQGQEAPAMNWHDFDNKRILGTVPVEADGSAYFTVPANRFVYFQLLDAKGRMVQSMRSGVIVQPGETNSCTGCHESRNDAPAPARAPALARRAPRRLAGWYGVDGDFSFVADVQPVLTRNCVGCHDYGKEAGKVLNLAPDRTLVFNTAYMDLHVKGFVRVTGAGPNRILQAYSWGSNASRLVEVLDGEHYDVRLSAEEYDRIVTWIDLNAPYYPTYASAYEDGVAGRGPLTMPDLRRLEKLTGRRVKTSHGAHPMISFDRPELSPILAGLRERDPDAHADALALLWAGRERLRKKPRADMPGFVASETDRRRKRKYDTLSAHQRRVRAAIRVGRKVYDSDLKLPADGG